MRTLRHVKIPHDSFSASVKDGSAGRKLRRILDEVKPRRFTLRSMEVAAAPS